MQQPSVWLARHGETEWSASGRHTSSTDVALTEAGRAAARSLTGRLDGTDFALVLCSPMRRARETCELAGFGDRAVIDSDLCEWGYGEYEGVTTEQIRRDRPGWNVFADGCPGGETAGDVGQRVDRIIDRVRREPGPSLLFAHGHVLRVLGARWVGLPPAGGALLALDTATVSVLGWERETATIRRWNAG